MPRTTAGGTERRKLRKRLIGLGLRVQSHIDGSITVFGKTQEETLAALATLGVEGARILPQKLGEGTTCFALPSTVAQGRIGQQFYRGTGEFYLHGARAEAYLAGGLQATQEAAGGAQEPDGATEAGEEPASEPVAVLEATEEVVETPQPPRRGRGNARRGRRGS